jgi:hypothetical protein
MFELARSCEAAGVTAHSRRQEEEFSREATYGEEAAKQSALWDRVFPSHNEPAPIGLTRELSLFFPQGRCRFQGRLVRQQSTSATGNAMGKTASSFLLSALCSILLCVIPAYSKRSADHLRLRHATLASVNGPTVYYGLVCPVVIAGVPLLLRARMYRVVSALLLIGFVVVGSASIGLLYLPSAVMMILAALVKPWGRATG